MRKKSKPLLKRILFALIYSVFILIFLITFLFSLIYLSINPIYSEDEREFLKSVKDISNQNSGMTKVVSLKSIAKFDWDFACIINKDYNYSDDDYEYDKYYVYGKYGKNVRRSFEENKSSILYHQTGIVFINSKGENFMYALYKSDLNIFKSKNICVRRENSFVKIGRDVGRDGRDGIIYMMFK